MNLYYTEYVNVCLSGSDLLIRYFITFPLKIVIYVSILAGILILIYIIYKSELGRTRRELGRNKLMMKELTRKLTLLETKSRSITESLNYAHRIQSALLPEDSVLTECFTDSFTLYLPKDIVSGDFYWFFRNGNRVFVVVADCTGHGVPGAMMSMIGHNLINNLIREQPEESPGKILDRLDKIVGSLFPGGKSEGSGIKESMDLSVCTVNLDTLTVEFSGAFLSVYYFSGDKLSEMKGDKYVMGMKPEGVKYNTHTARMKKGEPIYLFTDGYADQFGGEEGKKFMYRRLRYLLTTINRLPMNEQKIILEDTFENWRGKNEQVDDILLMGIRI